MDSDEGKLFIGGIALDTNEDKLIEYFCKYGDVTQTVVVRDRRTGRSRGFAFVLFADSSTPDRVLQEKHVIGGRTVDAKKAVSRENQQVSRPRSPYHRKGSEGEKNFRTKKIFVGGLPPTLTEDGFHRFFESYGHVTEVVIMYDQNTQRPRGFGFISFDSEDAVDRVLHKSFHELNGKRVEVKRAVPKYTIPGGVGRIVGYQGYGSPGANSWTFSYQVDDSRYIMPQSTARNHFINTGYGPGYGYGSANSYFGIGGYGGYGIGGYGSDTAQFSGLVGAFGSPHVHGAGYVCGPPGSLMALWNNMTPGYGASGYSPNAGYGAKASWYAAGSGGAVSAIMGQSPSGASAYGSQGYGRSNHDGSGNLYSNSDGCVISDGSGPDSIVNAGATGAEQKGVGNGQMGSGSGNVDGSLGYSNTACKSDFHKTFMV